MKLAIVYYTETGNTQKAAEYVAEGMKKMEGAEVALFPLGYPAEDAEPAPMHFKRRPADELVTRV